MSATTFTLPLIAVKVTIPAVSFPVVGRITAMAAVTGTASTAARPCKAPSDSSTENATAAGRTEGIFMAANIGVDLLQRKWEP